MDFDPAVVGIASQPFWLHWHDGERERRHAPDFFVRRVDGSAVVVDVRADDWIAPRDAEAFELTRRACARPTPATPGSSQTRPHAAEGLRPDGHAPGTGHHVVLDTGQPGAVLHAHPMDELASGTHRDVDVLLSMASNDMGWWVANDLDRFDPRTVDRIVDEVAGWRIPRSRAKKIVDAYNQGGRTPAEVRAALLTDYVFGLPAARGALAHAAGGGNAHLLPIGPAEGAPAVHGTEMYALVGQEQPGRSAEQAERDTRIRDIVLDFATGKQTGLWPAVTDRPASESVGIPPFEATAHYQQALDLWEGIDRA